jgi:Fe-S cluster assembly protein SufB
MVDEKINNSQTVLENVIESPYKYGFTTDIETENFPKGLNIDIVKKISNKKNESTFLKKFRINAFQQWEKMKSPSWAHLNNPEIDYRKIQYYSIPKTKKKTR